MGRMRMQSLGLRVTGRGNRSLMASWPQPGDLIPYLPDPDRRPSIDRTATVLVLSCLIVGCSNPPEPLVVLDEVVFYDGYAGLVDEPVPDGVLRLRNDLVSRRLDDRFLDRLADTLQVDVSVTARCDNYDRLGSVNLAFVPADSASYVPEDVQRLEVGRFVTPFMDMNREPASVDYTFDATHLLGTLGKRGQRADHDVWLELELFGVPYAANEEIPGCSGRNDVFGGSVTLTSQRADALAAYPTVLPLAHRVRFNNYQAEATDALGLTQRTLPFTLDEPVDAARMVLIVSNHGAGDQGEEYSRRRHHVHLDGEQVLQFRSGRDSCEPFRALNTQPNGIYGAQPRSPEEWQSFSNWCPGDVLDTHILGLGALSAGAHALVVEVPDAQFVGDDGNFPLSVYVQTRP